MYIYIYLNWLAPLQAQRPDLLQHKLKMLSSDYRKNL